MKAIDVRGASRVLAIGLPIAAVAYVLLPGWLRDWLPVDGDILKSSDGIALAPLALVLALAVGLAYWPFLEATVADARRTRVLRLSERGFGGFVSGAVMAAPVAAPLVAHGRTGTTLLVALAYSCSLLAGLEALRHRMRPATSADLLWSDSSLEFRRLFRPGLVCSAAGAVWLGGFLMVYEPNAAYLGYWIGVSLTAVSLFTYFPHFIFWFFRDLSAEFVWKALGLLAAGLLLVPANLDWTGVPAIAVGAACAAPFAFIVEWRRRGEFRRRVDELVSDGLQAQVAERYGVRFGPR